MSDTLLITLPVEPKSRPRHRCSCVQRGRKCPACGNRTGRPIPRMAPEHRQGRAIEGWKADVRTMLLHAWRGHKPINGPVRVSCTVVVARPKSRPTIAKRTTRDKVRVDNPRYLAGDFKVSREDWASGRRIPCPSKPDLDGYLGVLFDLLTECGVWWDDAQVCGFGRVGKYYAAADEDPSIRLRVEPW